MPARIPPRTSVRPTFRASLCFTLAFCGAACSAAEDNASGPRVGVNEPEGMNFFESEGGSAGSAAMDNFLDGEGKPSGPVTVADACVISRAQGTLVEQPVDIIFLLDNSGSMDEELQAVEDNINQNFASILIESGVDYRVILISRHRVEARSASESASTSVCVTTPLSTLASCEDGAPAPSLTDRFFQYSTKVDSVDSFDILLDTYLPPYTEDDREEKYDNAPRGWSGWLRPEAKQVFLEVTDDNEDMSMQAFLTELTTMAPEHFGAGPETPDFVFHSIVGLAEKAVPTEAYLPEEPLVAEGCGNDGDVTSVGTTYQELSRLTGGLRFPLCQFDAYNVVFQRIAEDVVQTSTIACDFAIPPDPVNANLDLNNIAVSYAPGSGGAPITFGQATSASGCQADAFYIASNGVNLCPEACATIRRDPTANVSVLFTCESQIILR